MREDYQTPALLEVRILADSVFGQAGELAAALAGRVGGQERPRPGRRAGQVGVAVGFPGRLKWPFRVISLTWSLGPRVRAGLGAWLLSPGLPRGW